MLGHTMRAFSLLALLASSCLAQVTLEHKFREGDSYPNETTVELKQKLTIAGSEIDTSSNTQLTSKTTVGKRDIEGKLRVSEKVSEMKVTATVMGQTYEFDSANPDQKGSSPLEMLRGLHKALMNRSTTIVYDKDDKAVSAEFDEALLGTLAPEVEPLVKSQLDPNNLKTEANEIRDQVKSDPIKPGDTWRRNKAQQLGAGQVLAFESEMTYVGSEKRNGRQLDKITSKVIGVTFSFENSPLPIQLKDSKLKPDETVSTLWFDRELGRIVEAESNLHVTGDLTFTANGSDLPAKLDLSMKSASISKP